MIKHFAFLAAALVWVGQAHAGVIQGVTIHSFSSQFATARFATNLVSNAGLFGHHHSVDVRTLWLTISSTSSNLTNAYVTFDLGSVRTIDKMKVWNYNEAVSGANILTRRGVKSANISVAGEDQIFTTNLTAQAFTRATGTFSDLHDTIDLGGISARYVRIDVLENFFEANDFHVGLSKVQFIDNDIAPTVVAATHNFLRDRVTVRFSEPVLLSTATNLSNYVVKSGATTATILSASFNTFQDTVTLQTSTLDSNLVYTVSVQNVRDIANVINVPNTEINIDPELVLWLKADENVTQDGVGFVTQWDDRSGLDNNAVQFNAGIQPVFVSGAVNGKPAIHFDGSVQVMEVPHHPSLVADRDITVYTVLSIDTLAGGKAPISKCNNNVPASFDYQIVANTGKPSFVRGNGFGFTTFNQSTAGLAINQFYITAVVMRGTNATHYLNGSFNGSAFVGAPIGDTGNPIRLGLRQDNHTAARFNGNLAEVLVLRGAASDADQSAINAYLGAKYGINVVTLSITSQPESVTRMVGQKATFAAAAVAGSPTIFYQWQKGAVNIPGATNSTYTTPTLTSLDNASTYRVIVSTPLGVSLNSDSATLTVLPDTQAPTVYSATRTTNATQIVVNFSELVDGASGINPLNYSLNRGATVVSAAFGSSSNVVVLTTSALDVNTSYALSIQNVEDLNSNGMTLTPTAVLPANPVFWIRADSGVVANPSGLVAQTDDQTIYQNHASQYVEVDRRPLLVSGAMNSKPVLRFDGLNDFLQAASSPSLAITGDITIYAVANFDDFAAGREIVAKTAVNQPASFDFYVQNSPLQTRLYRGNGLGANAVVAGTAPSAGVQHVLSVVQEGTTVSHFLEGAPNGVGVNASLLGDTGAPLRVGSRNDLFQFMKGDIAELLIFNRALSAAERKFLDNYLGAKYFPFNIAEQPASIARLEGETATFNVVAEAGGATFEYQWQKNLVDIPNATNASYTTPTLVPGDNNSSYRVVIFLPNGTTVNSDPALLTVSPDVEAPTIVHSGKKLWNQTQIVLVFSEAVDPSTATNINNYSLDNGAIVTAAAMGNTPNQVVLTISGLNAAASYIVTAQNVRDLFNNTMTPAPLPVGFYPANMSMWLNSETNVTTSGENLVTSWGDLSVNANNAYEIFGGSAPLFVENAINGHPAMRFDGTNNFLVANPTPSLALTGDMTLFVVAKFRDFVSTAFEIGLIEKSVGNLPAPFDFYLLKTSGLPRFYRGDGVESASITGTVAPSLDSAHFLSVKVRGTSAVIFMDGVTNGSGTINVPVADAGTHLGIGTRDDQRPRMNGDIAEIMIFSAALSDVDHAEIDAYLATKYGIISAPVALSVESSNNNIVVSWPVGPGSFVLQTKTSLSDPTWEVVTEAVVTTDGVNRVTVAPSGNESYYRLQNP